MNLTATAAHLVRLANELEDALINRNALDAARLADDCRVTATEIDREITSRRMRGKL